MQEQRLMMAISKSLKDAARAAAARRGVSLSEFIRSAITAALSPEEQMRRVANTIDECTQLLCEDAANR